MRFAYPALLLVLVVLTAITWISTVSATEPGDEALAFLKDVGSGGLAKTVRHFGGNACRCPAKGGWGAYLIYISAQEPNLAFMTGHPFSVGKPVPMRMQNNLKTMLPWEKPEDFAVDVPITFDAAHYSPVFLPLPMAYGHKITESELNDFLKDPDKDAWKGFTLRFRPSLQPGAIAPPAEPLPPEAQSEFVALQEAKKKPKIEPKIQNDLSTESAIREALGEKATQYLKPTDAGAVVDAKGQIIPSGEIEKRLPRLHSATLRLHIVRRGQLKDWTIYHFGLMEPVLALSTGEQIRLDHDHRPGEQEVKGIGDLTPGAK